MTEYALQTMQRGGLRSYHLWEQVGNIGTIFVTVIDNGLGHPIVTADFQYNYDQPEEMSYAVPGLYIVTDGYILEPNPELNIAAGSLIGNIENWRLFESGDTLSPGTYINGISTAPSASSTDSTQVALIQIDEEGDYWVCGYGARQIAQFPVSEPLEYLTWAWESPDGIKAFSHTEGGSEFYSYADGTWTLHDIEVLQNWSFTYTSRYDISVDGSQILYRTTSNLYSTNDTYLCDVSNAGIEYVLYEGDTVPAPPTEEGEHVSWELGYPNAYVVYMADAWNYDYVVTWGPDVGCYSVPNFPIEWDKPQQGAISQPSWYYTRTVFPSDTQTYLYGKVLIGRESLSDVILTNYPGRVEEESGDYTCTSLKFSALTTVVECDAGSPTDYYTTPDYPNYEQTWSTESEVVYNTKIEIGDETVYVLSRTETLNYVVNDVNSWADPQNFGNAKSLNYYYQDASYNYISETAAPSIKLRIRDTTARSATASVSPKSAPNWDDYIISRTTNRQYQVQAMDVVFDSIATDNASNDENPKIAYVMLLSTITADLTFVFATFNSQLPEGVDEDTIQLWGYYGGDKRVIELTGIFDLAPLVKPYIVEQIITGFGTIPGYYLPIPAMRGLAEHAQPMEEE